MPIATSRTLLLNLLVYEHPDSLTTKSLPQMLILTICWIPHKKIVSLTKKRSITFHSKKAMLRVGLKASNVAVKKSWASSTANTKNFFGLFFERRSRFFGSSRQYNIVYW